MKRLTRIAGIILLLVTVCYIGLATEFTQANIGILGGRMGIKQANLREAPNGSDILTYKITSVNGGVIFQGKAVPSGNAIGQPVTIQYNPAQPDGRRLVLTIGNTTVTTELYDWQIIPIAQFVESGFNACMTLYDDPENPEEEKIDDCYDEGEIYWANFHPALGDTLIGLNLFFVDAMLLNPFIMQNTNKAFSAQIPGYHITWRSEQKIVITLTRKARNFFEMLEREQDVIKSWNSYIYTDYGTQISYRIENRQILFSGVPAYLFVKNNHANKTVAEAKELNERIIAMHDDIYAINPTVYRTAEKTAQWAAFFRMVQAEYPQTWQLFIRQIAGIEASPKVELPRYWLPSGRD
ncbi:MAG: hypothetical protein LBB72_02530 [Spirochaetaceae bacterium]|nr:hypothetical protein [Spirochaetaceae bacterium]